MKLYITDICSLCYSDADIGFIEDPDRQERIRAAVMAGIGEKPRRKRIRPVYLLIAAVIAALLTTAAFAVSGYIMNMRLTAETVSGRWRYIDGEGNVILDREMKFPDAGLIIDFEGPENGYTVPEFHASWLPQGFPQRYTEEDCWLRGLKNPGYGKNVPFNINIQPVSPGVHSYVINGEAEILEQLQRGDWYVIKLRSDYRAAEADWPIDSANYIIAFDTQRGYLLRIGGTSDMEFLEKIAEGLRVRESGEAPEQHYTEIIAMLDIGGKG